MYQKDTIAAISTPLGESAIGIVRISGQDSLSILSKIFRKIGAQSLENIESHKLYHGEIVDPKTGKTIDRVIVSFMKGPKSFTGEDTVEISCHGGIVILKKVLEAAIFTGARLAERGEFTKRAFLNGKIDLAQAEAIIDLIKAKTETQAELALYQLKGKLSKTIQEIRKKIIYLLAKIESTVDFPDDVQDVSPEEIKKEIDLLKRRIETLLSSADFGIVFKEGIKTVIIGKPNVGKSSLLNALLRQERAIVTEIPGTTRDLIEEILNVRGIPLRIVDTAGLRKAKDKVEEIGIEKASKEISTADLILAVLDISEEIDSEDMNVLAKTSGKKAIIVVNKIDKADLHTKQGNINKIKEMFSEAIIAETSALYGIGLEDLEEKIFKIISEGRILPEEEPTVTNVRHKECLIRAKDALLEAEKTLNEKREIDLASIDLKNAAASLGEISGEEVSEEVINVIFSEFCVGK